jgi:hypothetical protein
VIGPDTFPPWPLLLMCLSCCLTTICHSAHWNAKMMIVSEVRLHVASGKQFSLTEPLLLGVNTHHGVQHAIAIAQNFI